MPNLWRGVEKNMKEIKFSEEWDKLIPSNFKVGNTFTTFRGYSPRKAKYYEMMALRKQEFNVLLNGKILGKAILENMGYAWSYDLDLKWIQDDTYSHFTREDFEKLLEKFYGNKIVFGIYLIFAIIEVEKK